MFVSLLFENALSPILVMLFGILILVKLFPENAFAPISTILSDSSIFVIQLPTKSEFNIFDIL